MPWFSGRCRGFGLTSGSAGRGTWIQVLIEGRRRCSRWLLFCGLCELSRLCIFYQSAWFYDERLTWILWSYLDRFCVGVLVYCHCKEGGIIVRTSSQLILISIQLNSSVACSACTISPLSCSNVCHHLQTDCICNPAITAEEDLQSKVHLPCLQGSNSAFSTCPSLQTNGIFISQLLACSYRAIVLQG